jgi:hypothetical protein
MFVAFAVCAGVLAGISTINQKLAGELIASLFNAEAAVCVWTANGWDRGTAIWISIAYSTCQTLFWFWIVGDLYPLLKRAEVFERRVAAGGIAMTMTGNMIRALAVRALFSLVVRPSSCDALRIRCRTYIPAVVLPIAVAGVMLAVGFIPMLIILGVFLLHALELEFWMAGALLALVAGNAAKIFVFGNISSHVADRLAQTIHLGSIPAAILTFGAVIIAQKIAERWLRKRLS